MISLRRLGKREDGQDLLEYGLLASLIAIFALAAVRLVGEIRSPMCSGEPLLHIELLTWSC